jgi:uncharacterized OB-fold protein
MAQDTDGSLPTQGTFPARMRDPYASELTEPFWQASLEGRLVCQRCNSCGTFRMPPTSFCFVCQSRDHDFTELPGTGTIYSFTVVRHPLAPQLADAVPYVSAVVELDGTQGAGARMLVNVADCDVEKAAIGRRVRVTFEKVSDEMAVPRFVPLDW